MRSLRRLVAGLALACAGGCGASGTSVGSPTGTPSPTIPTPAAASVSCAAFSLAGDPAGAGGARWTYASTDAGQVYRLEGILFTPPGPGPFPGVVVSHGAGGLPANYSAAIGREMVAWGLVVIGTRYTHAADPDGHNAQLMPAGPDGASEANVLRAKKTRDLLGCLSSVDLGRVAAHGHSMGAFVTGELLGTYPADFRAASHTAGGTSAGANATRPSTAALIRTPYQLHHGDADRVVSIAQDEGLASILATNAVPYEFHRYAGYSHEQMAFDPLMFERVRDWYRRYGVLR